MNSKSDKAVSTFQDILDKLIKSENIPNDIDSDKLINIALELTKSTLIASSIDDLGDTLKVLPEIWNFENFKLPLRVEIDTSKISG